MRSRAIILVGAMAAVAVWAVGSSPPAGAAVVVTSSGTSVTAALTGVTSLIALQCQGGNVAVLNTPATPALACTALTTAVLNGDGGSETYGATPVASFPALTQVTINASGGADTITGSTGREVIVGSTGNDRVTLPASGADDLVGLGGDSGDTVIVTGTAASEQIDVATGSPTSRTVVTRQTWDAVVTSTAVIEVNGGTGGDVLRAVDVTAASPLDRVTLRGGPDNDLLFCGAVTCTLVGDDGTNTLHGGPEADAIFTSSPTDTIRGQGGADGIADTGEGRVGRTIDPTNAGATGDNYQVSIRGDVHVRTRDLPSDGARVTVALGRSGRQDVDTSVARLIYDTATGSAAVDRALLDIEALPGQAQSIQGDSGTVVDIVVPTGSWSVSSDTVFFTGGYEPISLDPDATELIRAPFTDPEQRFAHRLIRDTQLRLPTPSERQTLRVAIEDGTQTRAQAALGLTNTDAYRGLAVDRAFVDVLRRGTDAAGRSYWIGRLRDGLVTRRLRANLYGSPEYVDTQGFGTDDGYVRAAYRDILGRAAGDDEVAYWVEQITEVGLPRGTVADRFLNTSESRQVVIRDLFSRWAGREPTGPELSTWSTQLGSSSTDGEVALIRFLAAGADYFNRPDA